MANQFTQKEIDEIKLFLAEYGSDVKKVDTECRTLLHKAVSSDDNARKATGTMFWSLAVARCLVERGSNVNATDKSGSTPLHLAIMENNVEAVKFLVSVEGVDINVRAEKFEFTPLRKAVFLGNVDIVKTLISHKDIDVNKPDYCGCTPLHTAIMRKHFDVCNILLSVEGIKINTESVNRNHRGDFFVDTPLHAAVDADNVELVKLLVSKGAKIDVKAGVKELVGGTTPLEMAGRRGYRSIVDYLSGRV